MRKLTQQEIDQAPEWAVEYYFDDKDLWYVNKKWRMAKILGCVRNLKRHSSVLIDAKPIPRKEFDISEYAPTDSDTSLYVGPELIYIQNISRDMAEVRKKDSIALAKHFKLTPSDLS